MSSKASRVLTMYSKFREESSAEGSVASLGATPSKALAVVSTTGKNKPARKLTR